MPNVGRPAGYVCHCNYLGADRKIIMGQKKKNEREKETPRYSVPSYLATKLTVSPKTSFSFFIIPLHAYFRMIFQQKPAALLIPTKL